MVKAQQKKDHNVLTPATVRYSKKHIPFEQKLTFGIKSIVGFNYFNTALSNGTNNSILSLKPLFGFGVIGNFKTHKHFSMRHELQVTYSRYIKENVNYGVSFSWLFNYHFKDHAFITMGVQPSLVIYENNYIETLGKYEDPVTSAIELNGVIGVEYPINDNLDLGIRVIKSFNTALKNDLPDFQGINISFSYYWHKFSSSERKLMDRKPHKVKFPFAKLF